MSDRPLIERLMEQAGGPDAFAALLAQLPPDQQARIVADWRLRARPDQLLPEGDWRIALACCGRAWGKTIAGSNWILSEVAAGRAGIVALVAPTAADLRDTVIEGPSGILRCAPPWLPTTYEPSKRRITFGNGAQAIAVSGEDSDRLRGLQYHRAWLDEACAIFDLPAVFDQVQMGLRLGPCPKMLITTTPRPSQFLRQLLADPSVYVVRGKTTDNTALSRSFVSAITSRYAGSRTGAQELDGVLLEDRQGALFKQADIDAGRVRQAPEDLLRVVVACDPAFSANKHSDLTGIVTAAVARCRCQGAEGNHLFVLSDETGRFSPAEWAQVVQGEFRKWKADRVVVERSGAGDLVVNNLRLNGGEHLPITEVVARRGKAIRAEGLASLVERHIVHFVGTGLAELESQMTGWSPLEDKYSPDRLDALVYAGEALVGDAMAEVPDPIDLPEDFRLYRFTATPER